ncbi:collagen alpha-1(III) chain-like [Mustela putorius furo]|uniref:Collagen alpha-1(III) chain-like n=1 Tax=Mustela putorius furo TaxID=9669 RepID=A0A8U0V623_MUSPF|nr:collagen alpha-1(III) chain-like [Mustela putorius furo]
MGPRRAPSPCRIGDRRSYAPPPPPAALLPLPSQEKEPLPGRSPRLRPPLPRPRRDSPGPRARPVLSRARAFGDRDGAVARTVCLAGRRCGTRACSAAGAPGVARLRVRRSLAGDGAAGGARTQPWVTRHRARRARRPRRVSGARPRAEESPSAPEAAAHALGDASLEARRGLDFLARSQPGASGKLGSAAGRPFPGPPPAPLRSGLVAGLVAPPARRGREVTSAAVRSEAAGWRACASSCWFAGKGRRGGRLPAGRSSRGCGGATRGPPGTRVRPPPRARGRGGPGRPQSPSPQFPSPHRLARPSPRSGAGQARDIRQGHRLAGRPRARGPGAHMAAVPEPRADPGPACWPLPPGLRPRGAGLRGCSARTRTHRLSEGPRHKASLPEAGRGGRPVLRPPTVAQEAAHPVPRQRRCPGGGRGRRCGAGDTRGRRAGDFRPSAASGAAPPPLHRGADSPREGRPPHFTGWGSRLGDRPRAPTLRASIWGRGPPRRASAAQRGPRGELARLLGQVHGSGPQQPRPASAPTLPQMLICGVLGLFPGTGPPTTSPQCLPGQGRTQRPDMKALSLPPALLQRSCPRPQPDPQMAGSAEGGLPPSPSNIQEPALLGPSWAACPKSAVAQRCRGVPTHRGPAPAHPCGTFALREGYDPGWQKLSRTTASGGPAGAGGRGAGGAQLNPEPPRGQGKARPSPAAQAPLLGRRG